MHIHIYIYVCQNYRFMVNRGPIEVQWLRSCWVSVPRRRKTSLGRVLLDEKKNVYIRQNQRDNPSPVTRSDGVAQTVLSLVVFRNNWNGGFLFHRSPATRFYRSSICTIYTHKSSPIDFSAFLVSFVNAHGCNQSVADLTIVW